MAAPPTTLTINYGSSSSVSIPINPLLSYTQMLNNLVVGGGVWFSNASGTQTFIPVEQWTSVTAQ